LSGIILRIKKKTWKNIVIFLKNLTATCAIGKLRSQTRIALEKVRQDLTFATYKKKSLKLFETNRGRTVLLGF
jgi:hypothetical protein